MDGYLNKHIPNEEECDESNKDDDDFMKQTNDDSPPPSEDEEDNNIKDTPRRSTRTSYRPDNLQMSFHGKKPTNPRNFHKRKESNSYRQK